MTLVMVIVMVNVTIMVGPGRMLFICELPRHMRGAKLN